MNEKTLADDNSEWDETLDLLIDGNAIITSDLSIGSYVTLKEELFHKMIEEINDNRIKNGSLTEGVDLIVIGEQDENNSEC